MSADNWTRCPLCLAVARIRLEAKKKKHETSYGKVSPEAWLSGNKKLQEEEVEIESYRKLSFREDYEIGIEEDGAFSVSYRGHCRECSVRYEFAHIVESAIMLPCPT